MVGSGYKGDTEPVSRRQAITDVIESIAMEEKAVSRILDAEARKICEAINVCGLEIQDFISIDEPVCECIKNLIKLQMLLQFKLEEIKDIVDDSDYC
jgi:hypothetical protein